MCVKLVYPTAFYATNYARLNLDFLRFLQKSFITLNIFQEYIWTFLTRTKVGISGD